MLLQQFLMGPRRFTFGKCLQFLGTLEREHPENTLSNTSLAERTFVRMTPFLLLLSEGNALQVSLRGRERGRGVEGQKCCAATLQIPGGNHRLSSGHSAGMNALQAQMIEA